MRIRQPRLEHQRRHACRLGRRELVNERQPSRLGPCIAAGHERAQLRFVLTHGRLEVRRQAGRPNKNIRSIDPYVKSPRLEPAEDRDRRRGKHITHGTTFRRQRLPLRPRDPPPQVLHRYNARVYQVKLLVLHPLHRLRVALQKLEVQAQFY